MKYFVNAIYNLESLKNEFRALSLKLHPDTGGNAAEFAEMLNEYKTLCTQLGGDPNGETSANDFTDMMGEPLKGSRGKTFADLVAYLVEVFTDEEKEKEYKEDTFKSVCFGWDGCALSPVTRRAFCEKYGRTLIEYGEKAARQYIATHSEEVEEKKREREEERAEAQRRAEEERREAEEEKRREQERIRKAQEESRQKVAEWSERLERMPENLAGKSCYNLDKKEIAAYMATTKRNIKKVINFYYPGLNVKVSLSAEIYKEHFTISWQDGPTEDEINAIEELQFFVSSYYESDPYADYGTYKEDKDTKPWRDAFGGSLGDCTDFDTVRTLSEKGTEEAINFADSMFKNYEKEKAFYKNERFSATFSEWDAFAKALNLEKVCGSWERVTNNFCNCPEEGFIYYSSLLGVMRENLKVSIFEKEEQKEFQPKYGPTYKAIKKALGGNSFCTYQHDDKTNSDDWQPVTIFAALLVGLQDVRICSGYNWDSGKHWSPFYSSNYTTARNRRDKFAAVGVIIDLDGKLKDVTPETAAALRAEFDDIARQQKEWDEQQTATAEGKPQQETTTATNQEQPTAEAEPTVTAESSAAPAEGLELVEIVGGVAVVGNSYKTYKNRKAIKAHGAQWNKEAKQWEATNPENVATLRAWFALREDVNTTTEEEQPTATAEPQPEQPQQEEQPTATAEPMQGGQEIGEFLAAVADMLAKMSDVMKEAARFEGVAVPAETLHRWREELQEGRKNTAETFAEVCACCASLTPESRAKFDALGVIFWTLSEQLRSGYDAAAISTATEYASGQMFDLIDQTQSAEDAAAIREAVESAA